MSSLGFLDCEGSAMPPESLRTEPAYERLGPEPFLATGSRLVEERGARYGHPRDNYRRIGIIWQGILDLEKPIPPALVGLMLTGVKIGRLVETPFDADGLDDLEGYAHAQRLLGEA